MQILTQLKIAMRHATEGRYAGKRPGAVLVAHEDLGALIEIAEAADQVITRAMVSGDFGADEAEDLGLDDLERALLKLEQVGHGSWWISEWIRGTSDAKDSA